MSGSRGLRELLFVRSGGVCQCDGICGNHEARCSAVLTIDSFHKSHLRARVNGGVESPENLEAWCSRCNLGLGPHDARDPRWPPRPWQLREINRIVQAQVRTRSATLSAAPGAGKTIFAGFDFEALRDLGLVERMVVVVPRRGLAEQWAKALFEARQITLKPHSAVERPGQDGVVVTYQSLAAEGMALETHKMMVASRPTLLVLDEPHHLGQDIAGTHKAWGRAIADLAGDVETQDIRVAAILNISGTLWRSKRSERISTVRYTPADEEGKIKTLVDGEVTVEELILAGQLRPIDLYRLNARIRLADYADLTYVQGMLSDLDEQRERATLASLGAIEEWRTPFVAQVLTLLEQAHRTLGGYHAKALIVAARQDHARAFRDEVDRQMRAAGRQPLAVVATSDDPDAQNTLDHFRRQKRVGVLCTVDMAGEGYDCPEIAVIGYATNKATTLYVRQVAARAMRVTEREREMGGALPAMIVLPDSATLVEQFIGYMAPYTHEIIDRIGGETAEIDRVADGQQLRLRRFELTEAEAAAQKVTVPYADGSWEDIDMALAESLIANLRAANLPDVYHPRIIASSQRTIRDLLQTRPFDTGAQFAEEEPRTAVTTLASSEDQATLLQQQLDKASRKWATRGDTNALPVSHLNQLANAAGGISSGKRSTASVQQLQRALDEMRRLIGQHGGFR